MVARLILRLILFAAIALTFFPNAAEAEDAGAKQLIPVPLADAPAGSKIALVIGVDDYENAPKLTDCGGDAKVFADALRDKLGFNQIEIMTDDAANPKLRPTYTNIRHELRVMLADIVPNKTQFVLFYSGHGTRGDGDADWLVPSDGDPEDISGTCINYTDFRSRLDENRPASALLILDACRSLFSGKAAGAGSGFGPSTTPLGPQEAELLSCEPTEVSQEGDPKDFQQSVFTHFLIQGLSSPQAADSSGNVTFESLKQYLQGQVSQYVRAAFNTDQMPVGEATAGDMVILKGVAAPLAPPEPPAEAALDALEKDKKDQITSGQIRLRIVPVIITGEGSTQKIIAYLKPVPDGTALQVGTHLVIQAQNTTTKALYLTVIAVPSQGGMGIVWPGEWRGGSILQPSDANTADNGWKTLCWDSQGKQPSIMHMVTPDPSDFLEVIATEQPADFNGLVFSAKGLGDAGDELRATGPASLTSGTWSASRFHFTVIGANTP